MTALATRRRCANSSRLPRARAATRLRLSPTHSLFGADSAHYGPYSPSNRLFLNPLYADPAIVFGRSVSQRSRATRPRKRNPAL